MAARKYPRERVATERSGRSLLPFLDRPDWFDDAACRGMGPEMFFPGKSEMYTEVTALCGSCPVSDECLDYGMAEHYGYWGGKSERQRRNLRRRK